MAAIKKTEKTENTEKTEKTENTENTENTEKTQTYVVQWSLDFDGKSYQAGDELQLDDAQADELLFAGVIELKSEQ